MSLNYQVDPAYYISHTTDYTSFADAIQNVGPGPCTVFDCPRQQQCKEEKVECKAFRYWVNNGSFETQSKKDGGMISIEKGVGKLLQPIK